MDQCRRQVRQIEEIKVHKEIKVKNKKLFKIQIIWSNGNSAMLNILIFLQPAKILLLKINGRQFGWLNMLFNTILELFLFFIFYFYTLDITVFQCSRVWGIGGHIGIKDRPSYKWSSVFYGFKGAAHYHSSFAFIKISEAHALVYHHHHQPVVLAFIKPFITIIILGAFTNYTILFG